MTLRWLSGTECTDGDTCPTIFERDVHTVIVQGYIIKLGGDIPAGQAAVEIPIDLLIKAAEQMKPYPLPSADGYDHGQAAIHQSADHTLIVRGWSVAADELKVPAGEAAVAIPAYVLIQAAKELARHAA